MSIEYKDIDSIPSVSGVVTSSLIMQEGQIVSVQPLTLGVASPVIPHGREFAVVLLLRGGSGSLPLSDDFEETLWRGYIVSDGSRHGGPVSHPAITCKSGQTLVVQLSHNGEPLITGEVIRFRIGVEKDPRLFQTASQIWQENPGDGMGESRVISLGDPAAGADYATVTVPSFERWKVRGFQGTLVASAVVANRSHKLNFTDGVNTFTGVATGSSHPASLSASYKYGISSGFNYTNETTVSGTRNIMASIPELVLKNAFTIQFITGNLDVGDNWGPGFMLVESWATL